VRLSAAQYPGEDMAGAKKGGDGPIVIKKYANRRLYNTATSSYVTLEHLRDMVKEGVEFNVFDAKTSEDITRSVLAQIIFEEEGKQGQNMLPIAFLRQLIKFYGDRLQAFVPGYLEMSMEGLTKNADNVRQNVTDAFGGKIGAFNVAGYEDLARQNVQMFQRALKMFTPFGRFGTRSGETDDATATEPAKTDTDEISELKAQLDAMRKQLDSLANRSK
jgi:polyhydroxyalkanoate synthesis repressor PhaR